MRFMCRMLHVTHNVCFSPFCRHRLVLYIFSLSTTRLNEVFVCLFDCCYAGAVNSMVKRTFNHDNNQKTNAIVCTLYTLKKNFFFRSVVCMLFLECDCSFLFDFGCSLFIFTKSTCSVFIKPKASGKIALI